jgi:type II secretory pathway predicted ATPase ExeA
MYEGYFGLKEKPFALTPNPAFLYLSSQHENALAALDYGLKNQAGFSVITGEIGSGKTTLIRAFLNRQRDSLTIGLVSNTNRSFGKLLQWVCLAFGLPYRGKDDAELYESFVDFLIGEYSRGRRVALIVDEAQNLEATRLEELRVLSNINADEHLVLQTVLVGQPELRTMLRSPELRQFAQRVGIDTHLNALSLRDTALYVKHRLRIAGTEQALFEQAAITLMHRHATGIPRLINQLCDTALVYAFAEQRKLVDAELMRQVIEDRSSGGILPVLAPPPMTAPSEAAPQDTAWALSQS